MRRRTLLTVAAATALLFSAEARAKHPLPGPHFFLCQPLLFGVRVSWDELGIGDGSLHAARLYRDGDLIVVLDPDATSYDDEDAPAGYHLYRIDIGDAEQPDADPIASYECDLTIGEVSCEVFGGVAVPPELVIAWGGPFDADPRVVAIRILRDGEIAAELDPGTISYTEEPLSGQAVEYAVVAVVNRPEEDTDEVPLGSCVVEWRPPVIGGFIRGDCNGDGAPDISDAVCILNYLFATLGEPGCLKSADTDDTGEVELTDAVYLLNHLFLGGPAVAEPFQGCGHDPTADDLTCARHAPCLNPPPP